MTWHHGPTCRHRSAPLLHRQGAPTLPSFSLSCPCPSAPPPSPSSPAPPFPSPHMHNPTFPGSSHYQTWFTISSIFKPFFLHLERERRQQSNLNVVTIYILVNLGMINYLGGGGASGFNDRTRLPRSSLMEFSRVKHTVAHITT